MLDTLFREIRLAVRSLARSPGFTVVAVITLALGIGANTALFTVLKSVVLDSLPFENPDRLAVVLHVVETSGEDATAFSPADYLDLRDQSRTFETLAGHRTRNVTMTGRGRPERLRGESVSSGFFQVFGVEPELGRFFLPEDESGSPETRSMVLSHAAWMGRFGGDPGIVGSHLTLDGEPHVVLGVAPPQFRYSDESEIWIRAYRADVPEPPMDVGEDLASIRSMGYFSVVGRLAAGATFDQAQAELDLIAARLDEAVPEGRERTLLKVVPLREDLVGQVRPALLLLLGAVGTVLLIACANVANLLLARSTGRLREAAIRSAVGASRWQIVRQMLVESTVLGAIAGAAGLLVGVWAVDALVALAPEDLPRAAEIAVDTQVLLFAVGLSLLTAVLFGLLPALRTSRPDLQPALRESSRSATGGRASRRLQAAIVGTEVALALVLLCGASLFVKSLARLMSVEPGFRQENLLTMRMDLPSSRYDDGARMRSFVRELTEGVEALPGVSSAGTALTRPLGGNGAVLTLRIEGRDFDPEDTPLAAYQTVTPGYFRTMGIPLVAGRTLEERDGDGAPLVAVINESLARRQWPGEDPIGRRIGIGTPDGVYLEVVGVVGDVRHWGLDLRAEPEVYVPYDQAPWPFFTLMVRTTVDPLSLAGQVRDQIRGLDPEQAAYGVTTMEQVVTGTTKQRRFTTLLAGVFTGIALVLAAVGIYGVLSVAVGQRVHEMGVRIALGAQRAQVVRLILRWGVRIVGAGIAAGLVGAYALGRLIASMLYATSPLDVSVFVGAPLLLLSTAILAACLPAYRASRVDPVVALRCE